MPARASLKARALAWLAQREHSRDELRAKLLRRARADAAADAASADPDPAAIDALLDWLEAHGYLSQARFADARVHLRAPRHGAERIRRELAQHGVALDAEALRALRESELERATLVWQRKFGRVAADAAGRAKQARFLAGRGFSAEVIRRLVQAGAAAAD
jgi:regulatory protein